MLVVLSFISQALVVVDTDSYSSAVVEDSSILEELSEQNGARTGEPSNLSIPFTSVAAQQSDCSCRGNIMVLGDKFIFGGRSNNDSYDPPHGGDSSGVMTLYISDGTISGTTSLNKTIGPYGEDIDENQFLYPIHHIVMNDVLYFNFDDGKDETGKELWRTDGTEDGTYLVKDIREGADDPGTGVLSYIRDFVEYDNHIYFSATNDDGPNELWKSDGTEEGTVQITNLSLGVYYLTVINDEIYFNGLNEDNARVLWKSDGTGEGTVKVNDGAYISDRPFALGDHLYFKGYSGDHGGELWRTDGTDEGTVLVKDIRPGSSSSDIKNLRVEGDYIYFTAWDGTADQYENLWKSDGTAEGTVKISNLEKMYFGGGAIFLSESQAVLQMDDYWGDEEYRKEPYVFDLTGVEEPRILKDFNPSENGQYIDRFVLGANGVFYFAASNGQESSNNQVLWRSDGTDNGTWMVDFLAHTQTDVGNQVFFRLGENLIFSSWSNTEQEEGKWRPACGLECGDGSDFWKLNIGYPSNSAPTPSYTLYKGKVINPITFDYDGEDSTWEIYPDLPTGLAINSEDGTITGTPTELLSRTYYTVYANGSSEQTYEISISVVEPDTDGDGVLDINDAFPDDITEWEDTDGDEIGNNADPDDDGDGYNDTVEIAEGSDPLDIESTPLDTDGDFDPDSTDPDDDADGYNDTVEVAEGSEPLNFTSTPVDTDGDFDPDSTDPDDDNDGYDDGNDTFPLDKDEWLDNDDDGIGDNADTDDDNDGLDDIVEDANGNGTVDEGETDPLDPDTDNDGYCDGPINVTIDEVQICEVEDRDGDGIADDFDAFPDDITEWEDTDGDEIGNNADPDDDGDGYDDTVEAAEGSDSLNFTSTPLDTDGDFDPDSTDPDDDGDGFNDGVDAFPLDSSEWFDTDGDGIGNEADPDDDGDGLNDTEEISLGSNPLDPDTDDDGIPDTWDPLPVDADGDFDGDGILDRDEYNPNSTTGTPGDADGDGINDMRQALASTNTTSDSGRSFDEFCWWFLLLLLLLLIPLLKRQYDNALIYTPHVVEYTIDDNDAKIRMVPALHEYAKNYRSYMKYEDLRSVTYGISGNLVEGLEIDSKTGVISGHPKKVGEYKYEIVMKHSDGKFKGEITINVSEKKEESEKEEEPVAVATSNPEPENTSSKPKFDGGAGTKMDPFVITPAKGLEPGEIISSKQVITISGLKSAGIVNMQDLDIKDNGKRFAIIEDPDEVGRQSAIVANDDGEIKFRVNFKDDKPSTDGADYEGLIKLGTASVYLSWAVEITKEESEKEPLSKEQKKEKELERIKARSEKIDFEVLGEATSSTLSKPVEKDASEIDLEDASDFEKAGTATITDADGSEIITWTSKKGNALFGIAGLTRAFVAASIVVAKDDLQVIKGIGPFIEEKLNALGIYMFVQIARMTPDLEEEVNVAIEFFPGRVKRDEWVKQANQLVE